MSEYFFVAPVAPFQRPLCPPVCALSLCRFNFVKPVLLLKLAAHCMTHAPSLFCTIPPAGGGTVTTLLRIFTRLLAFYFLINVRNEVVGDTLADIIFGTD